MELQSAHRTVASKLLVDEGYFQADIAQGLSVQGEAEARAILSQGPFITPGIVADLNALLTVEEVLRRAEASPEATVKYPQFTEAQLNQYLSLDAVASELNERSSVVEVQAVVQPEVNSAQIESQTLSFDQGCLQAEVPEPPVAGYESKSTNPQLQQEANAMVVVQERPTVQTEIDLHDLMSVKTLGIIEGNTPRKRVEIDGKPQLVDRSPSEAFGMVARAAYGAQNFCQENNLPHTPATEVIAAAADRLSLNGPEVTGVLDSTDKAKCRPSIEVATKSQVGVWARIEEKYPEYADKMPEAIRTELETGKAAIAEATTEAAKATTRQVERQVLKQKEAPAVETKLPSQAEMAVTVAAFRLKEEGSDRWGHDNDKATLIFNRSKKGNISVINKADNQVIATRNSVTGQVTGNVPESMDFSKAYSSVVEAQTQKYTPTAAVASQAKSGDGR